jgi:hypothetical protein
MSLQTAAGGFSITGSSPLFLSGFGNVNGLGIGTPHTGISVMTNGVAGGVLYTTSYNFSVTGAGFPKAAVIKAYVSTNFVHPSTLQLKSCYPAAACTSASSFVTLPAGAASAVDVVPLPGVHNGTTTAALALFVSNINGAGAFTGADIATITFVLYGYDSNDGTLTFQETDTLSLSNPTESVQTALQLSLATAPGGLTISPASDYAVNFGNVNGLGISPGAGLTSQPGAGGALYSTPYQVRPNFSGFITTSASVKVYVSTDFAHPAVLELRDSSNNSAFTPISKSSGTPTTLTSSANSGSTLTRYLGLFVSNANGPGTFNGTDNARLTYTFTAP